MCRSVSLDLRTQSSPAGLSPYFKSPRRTRRTRRNAEQESVPNSFRLRGLRGSSTRHIWKINIGGHARAQLIVVVWQTNLHPEHLPNSIFHGLDVARCEFGLTIDLLDHARKIFPRKRIDLDAHLIANFNFTKPRLGNVNADPQMLGKEQGCDFLVKRRNQNVARLHVEHFE